MGYKPLNKIESHEFMLTQISCIFLSTRTPDQGRRMKFVVEKAGSPTLMECLMLMPSVRDRAGSFAV